MRDALLVRVGPVGFRVGAAWRTPVTQLRDFYADYPAPVGGVPDFTVRLEPAAPGRRLIRPSVRINGDFRLPEAAPLPLAHALLAAEMGMNLQLALGHTRHLLLHAATVEKDGRALLLTGESGAGKSTLAALLATRGWRLLGDEFALIDPASGLAHPFPRPISLKNAAIDVLAREVPIWRWGPRLIGTPKGDIRHLVPDRRALAGMDEPAQPALILFPRYGHDHDERPIGATELFVRLTQASPNYVALGERGFACLTRLVAEVPALAIDYPDAGAGLDAVERLWAEA